MIVECVTITIQEIYDESNQIFGVAKIAAVMKSEGFKVSNEMVRTLMRDMGLVSIRQSAKKLYEDEGRKYKNHLNQEFDTCKPNEVWVSDVTYFKYGENAYYICVIIADIVWNSVDRRGQKNIGVCVFAQRQPLLFQHLFLSCILFHPFTLSLENGRAPLFMALRCVELRQLILQG